MPLVLRTDADRPIPPLLRRVLAERGWLEYDSRLGPDEQPPWNLWWRSSRFGPAQIALCRYPYQRLNHFPKTDEITKKDTLLRNIRRMRGIYGAVYNVLPTTFSLPVDQAKFAEEWRERRQKKPGTSWICKPSELSRGRHIYIFRELSELHYEVPVVVQLYIDRPLLLAGYKFDLRVYVMVTSYQPLRVYVHRNYMVRFSTEKYDMSDLRNLCSHLTNTSLNKKSSGCVAEKEGVGVGCKWQGSEFTSYLSAAGISMDVLWTRIDNVILLTLLSIATQVPQTTSCFELYGFDLLLDQSFKPWLLEVNFSPALQIDGPVDEAVKGPLVRDTIDVLNISEDPAHRRYYRAGRRSMSANRPEGPAGPAPRASQPQPPPATPIPDERCSTAPTRASSGVRGLGSRAQTPHTAARPSLSSRGFRSASASRVLTQPTFAQPAAAAPSRPASAESDAPPQPPQHRSANVFVDRPSGGFECIYPFDCSVSASAARLRADDAHEVVAEVRRREHRAKEASKDFGRLHKAYELQRFGIVAAPASETASERSAAPPPVSSAPPRTAAELRQKQLRGDRTAAAVATAERQPVLRQQQHVLESQPVLRRQHDREPPAVGLRAAEELFRLRRQPRPSVLPQRRAPARASELTLRSDKRPAAKPHPPLPRADLRL
eukprot:TRINITY_DN8074_c1_g2_i1.p1 TRINITY_DN8074_c1_g2~~TRINITY_DN8074_c1_g2_i1.p1  ORF type:complete len:676 (+),score=206.98 TRINITY_DN8074_c1_g2_i1:49-2028(+)